MKIKFSHLLRNISEWKKYIAWAFRFKRWYMFYPISWGKSIALTFHSKTDIYSLGFNFLGLFTFGCRLEISHKIVRHGFTVVESEVIQKALIDAE